MTINKKTASAILKQCRELTMTPETVCVYLAMVVNNGKSVNSKEIAEITGLGIKTVRKHMRLLEVHEALELGGPVGREKRREVVVKPVKSYTLPSPILSSLYTILDIPSQKSYARLAMTSITREENGSERVGLDSAENFYTNGKYGLAKAARQAVHKAVENGEIEQSKKCIDCGLPCATVPYHFKGYHHSNWFAIKWLCRSCYAKVSPGNLKRKKFTVAYIQEDEDWKKAHEILKKYFKEFEIDPKVLTKNRRFSTLVGLLEDEEFDFNGYAHWYDQYKYAERGFNFGLFLYPGMISEYRSYAEKSGEYLKTSSRINKSKTFKSGVKKTKEFLSSLEDVEE